MQSKFTLILGYLTRKSCFEQLLSYCSYFEIKNTHTYTCTFINENNSSQSTR